MLKKIPSIILGLTLCFTSSAYAGKTSPETVNGATTVNTVKAKSLFDNEVLFLDVRKDSDWDAGRVPGAIHIELKKKLNEVSLSAEIKKDEAVVIYCNGPSCLRSSKASKMVVGWGFSKVYYYRDGFPAWKAASYPVE